MDANEFPEANLPTEVPSDTSKPLRGAIICCTSVAEEKRVSDSTCAASE